VTPASKLVSGAQKIIVELLAKPSPFGLDRSLRRPSARQAQAGPLFGPRERRKE
jgi:hypothetical protein